MITEKIPQPLSTASLLKLWEIARQASRSVRVQAMLRAALPEAEHGDTDSWCIGESDAFLLRLYRSMFGNRFDCRTDCPACASELELTLEVENLLTTHGIGSDTYQVTCPEPAQTIFFRLPKRADVEAIPAGEPSAILQQRLVENCMLLAKRGGKKISPIPLSKKVITAVSEAMSRADPQAEILLNMKCPACQHDWQTIFDIVDFLWQKICSEAGRLVTEIHTLARVYGWTESEILALSKERRKIYLDLITL